MLLNKKLIIQGCLLLFILHITGCAVKQPLKTPDTIKPPVSFNEEVEQETDAQLVSWRNVFDDPVLVALIDTAISRNPDMMIATQRIEMARSVIMARHGAMLPNLNAEIAGGGRKFGDYTMDGVGNYDTNFSPNLDDDRMLPAPFLPDYFLGVRSTWEIDIWGKMKAQKKAAIQRFLASEKGRHLIQTELVSSVANLYYEMLSLDYELGIIQRNIEIQEKATEIISIQKEGGRATELAVRQFTAQLLNTQSLEFEIKQRIVETENQLNLLLGRFPQEIPRGESIFAQNLPGNFNLGAPLQMLSRRPDIQQSQLLFAASNEDLQAARLAFLPALSISAHMGFNAFAGSLWFAPGSIAYSALGGLTAPLLNRKGLKADKAYKMAESIEAFHNYNKSVLNAYQEVISYNKALENLAQMSTFKRREVTALQQAVAISNDLFVGGAASYLEIFTAQKSVLEAEIQLTEMQQKQFQASIQLYRALGGGWE